MVFNDVASLRERTPKTANDYAALRVLVVDDFENFRLALSKMLYQFGCKNVDTVMNGNRAIRACEEGHFDVILCDYGLGPGPNGQQVLEALRARNLLSCNSLFVLMSAETSKSIVLSAYDYEPDALLSKPITGKGLKQRLDRLLHQRYEMMDINKCLDQGDTAGAIKAARAKVDSGSRYSTLCQKLLGRLYLNDGRIDEAEVLYGKVLAARPLDWARLGMARVRRARGDLQAANELLEAIITEHPFCMQAYDEQAENWRQQGRPEALQRTLQQAVDVSPMAILRQSALGEAAAQNRDFEVASRAYGRTVKLGEHSYYDQLDTHLQFLRTTAACMREGAVSAADTVRDALRVSEQLGKRFKLTDETRVQAQLLECQLYTVRGEKQKAQELMLALEEELQHRSFGLTTQLDRVAVLRDLGEETKARTLLQQLTSHYKHDQSALEAIDPWLDEPVSERNRKRLAHLNNEGIALYHEQEYERALGNFTRASRYYPRHIGVHLNLAQALISAMKESGTTEESVDRCLQALQRVEGLVAPGNPHLQRYRQLQQMLRKLESDNEPFRSHS